MVRCKFVCVSKREYTQYGVSGPVYDYQFSAVTGNNSESNDENKKFWKYTPSGQLNVSAVTNDQFIVGKDYYLDLSAV